MERFTEWDFDRKGKKVSAFTQELIIYCGDCYIGEPIDKLAHYEDLEEQGLLLKLPCKVGDIVWTLKFPEITKEDGSVWTVCDRKKQTVVPVKFTLFILNDIGVYYFLTKEEAERKLERIKNNE